MPPFSLPPCAMAHRKGFNMPNSPKDNEEKLSRILNAWKTLASDKAFGGMTVEQFETAIAPSKTARAKIADLDSQMTHAITPAIESVNRLLSQRRLWLSEL